MVRTAKLLEPSSVRRLTPLSRMPAARRFIGVAKPYAQASVENNKLRGERALRVTPWYTKKYRVPYTFNIWSSRFGGVVNLSGLLGGKDLLLLSNLIFSIEFI